MTQAFPTWAPTDVNGQTIQDGMTLRDYFAAKAMQAIVTTLAATNHIGEESDADKVARAAYQMADAMMKARQS